MLCPWTKDFQQLQRQVNQIMATTAEQTTKLQALSASIDAIATAVMALKHASGQTTPEQDTSLTDLTAKITALATLAAA
jgi:hypothetical protein